MSSSSPWSFRLLALMPLPVLHGCAYLAGSLFAAIPNRKRRITRINLKLSFPEMGNAARRSIERRSLIESLKTALEMAALLSRGKRRTLGLIRKVSGEQWVIEAMAAGKGVIIAAPHLGAWEMVGLYCSDKYPMTSLYRPLHRSPDWDRAIREGRQRLGARLVPTDAGGVRAIYDALGKGEMIGILPDQNPGIGKGVFAPFFKVPANTGVLLSRLVQKSGAAVVFAYAERLPWGRGYHMHFAPGSAQIADKDLAESAAALNRGIEECVRELPEQYWWSYKRYRTRPPGEPKIY